MLHSNPKRRELPIGERQWYDVFISFRGSDVRNTFADHLRAALRREGVRSFSDRHDLPRGQDLKEAIPRAIERSRFSIVVCSPSYASSAWCLDELVTIMRCCRGSSSTVAIPIFYRVSPGEVSSAGCEGRYKVDLDRHKRRYTYERVDGWLQALAWIADISGWVVPAGGCRSEARLVERIARTMRQKVLQYQLATEESVSPSSGERNNMNLPIVAAWGRNHINYNHWRKMSSKRNVFVDDSSEKYLIEDKHKPMFEEGHLFTI